MNIAFDGGVTLLLLIAAISAAGVVAYRKRYGRPKLQVAGGNGGTAPSGNPPNPQSSGQAGTSKPSSKSRFSTDGLLKKAWAALVVVLVLWLIVRTVASGWHAFMDWSPAGSSHRVATPSAGQPANEASGTQCQAWARNHQTCRLTEPATIMLPPGTPAGQSFCWSPTANAFASIRVILPDGSLRNFDSSNLGLQVVGYEFTPVQGRETNLDYWLAPGLCTPA